jgi:probable F420-dependent oxidoreductase
MMIGCDLPYYPDPGAVRAFAQAAEDIGYSYLAVREHVLAVRDDSPPPLSSPPGPSYECVTMLSFLSAVTSRIGLSTSMLLLPLRPAALAAKQAAEIDLLSGQRLRLAVAVGRSRGEAEAHGVVPGDRGELIEEQVEAMRLLWTQPEVHYQGRHVRISHAALDRRPGRAIPVWMGGGTLRSRGLPPPRAMRRIAALADGFTMSTVLGPQPERGAEVITRLLDLVGQAGRSRSAFGIEARLTSRSRRPQGAERWRQAGATHLTVGARTVGAVDVAIADLTEIFETLPAPHDPAPHDPAPQR